MYSSIRSIGHRSYSREVDIAIQTKYHMIVTDVVEYRNISLLGQSLQSEIFECRMDCSTFESVNVISISKYRNVSVLGQLFKCIRNPLLGQLLELDRCRSMWEP